MNAVFASRIVTKETTLEGSMRNDTGASAQSLSPSVRQPFERGEFLMTTAIGHANGQPTKLLSPFVRLGDSPTTGASPAGNGWCDFNTAARQDARPARNRAHGVANPAAAFREFLLSHGLHPDDSVVPTGNRVQRCPVDDDKPGRTSGWYVLYVDGLPAGEAGDWRTGESWTWCAKEKDSLSLEELKIAQAHLERSRKAREQERARLAAEAAARAADIWAKSNACEAHPYLSAKCNASCGLRLSAGKLLVPVMDMAGTMRSLQFIDAGGNKKFLFGGAIAGCFHRIPGTNDVVAVAEGYATAASIHMATGWTVLTAFNAGNLLPVARAWRQVHPECRMVICGDDDRWTKGNPGRAKAEACAREVGAATLFPSFASGAGRLTDWNDLHQREGLEEVKRQLLAGAGQRKRDIRSWGLERFAGQAPERRWLVENIMPCGAVFVLAAMGDAGKGMLTLDLGLKVAGKTPLRRGNGGERDFNPDLTAFGNRILRQGPVAVISAEDSADEVHRRLQSIGVGRAREMYVLPLPNAGGPLPVIVPGKHGPELSADWLELRAQLVELRPALIVIDPLASFVMADINTDPAVGAFTMGHMAQLAQETDAAVVLVHHLAKSKANVVTPEEARALIRGTSAIVDNARAAYVLWGVEEKAGRAACSALGVEWARNSVMKGCLVKSNGPGDREIKTWIRNKAGLLEVRNEQLRSVARERTPALLDSLAAACAEAAQRGQPFTKTGANGLFTRRQELPAELRSLARHPLETYAQRLLEAKRLVLCIAKGSTSKKWLDVPDGDFALGLGQFATGATEDKENDS